MVLQQCLACNHLVSERFDYVDLYTRILPIVTPYFYVVYYKVTRNFTLHASHKHCIISMEENNGAILFDTDDTGGGSGTRADKFYV